MFWKISWWGIKFLYKYIFENGRDRNYLNSIIKENKHKAPKTLKTKTTSQQHRQTTMDIICRTKNKKRTLKDREIHWRIKEKFWSPNQSNTKKIAWQKNVKLQVQLNIQDCHGRFNWLHPKMLARSPNIHEHKIRESLKINNSETKAEYNKSIQVLNRDQDNTVNTNSWKPLFRKVNMVRRANVIK